MPKAKIWRRGLAVLAVMVLALVCASRPVAAHGGRSDAGPVTGIPIPNLTHGQMAVIADHFGEILDLAAGQVRKDEPFRRLMNYANIQFSFCLWGLVPGGVTDEASPFNECSHAYLAAARAVLTRMLDDPARTPAVDALVSRVEVEMLMNRASLVLCQYSSETFDTARIIRPDWRGVLGHPPSLAAFAGAGVLAAGGIGAILFATSPRRTRRTPDRRNAGAKA